MTMIRNLYYAAWANLSQLPMIGRAAIVLAVLVVFIWTATRPLLRKLLVLLLQLLNLFVKLICLIGGKILGITAKRSPERYAARYNRMVDLMGRCNERLLTWSARLKNKHQFHLGRMLLLYGVLMVLVSLPALLKPIIAEEYIPYFSLASNLYQKIETPALKAAAAYNPLFSSFSSKENVDTEEPNPVEDLPPEIWLTLSERGWNGSNVRTGPGKDHRSLGVIMGDTQILYLGERDGRWVHIQTEDGMEGWIHDSLVIGLPEEPSE